MTESGNDPFRPDCGAFRELGNSKTTDDFVRSGLSDYRIREIAEYVHREAGPHVCEAMDELLGEIRRCHTLMNLAITSLSAMPAAGVSVKVQYYNVDGSPRLRPI